MVVVQLFSLYRSFDAAERQLADQVITEWVGSEQESIRFDALALVREFQIRSAAPALRALTVRLRSSDAPGAPYEIRKIERTLGALIARGA